MIKNKKSRKKIPYFKKYTWGIKCYTTISEYEKSVYGSSIGRYRIANCVYKYEPNPIFHLESSWRLKPYFVANNLTKKLFYYLCIEDKLKS